jgi:serine/threonine protein kinase
MAESSGELLGGRYRLLGERTSFPFGSWWEAEDDQGARTVVLRMHAEVVDPAGKAKAAIATTASIDSPHIVPWADGGVDAQGHGWLAAPMFGPWSLTEHVSRGEGVPPAEAAPLVHQLARAIAAGEAAKVLHHCLTSELVRLVPLPEGGYGVKVYGYGLSDLLPPFKPLRKQDAYLGVPDYMSPELCAGKAAEGSSADVYALGIIMYEAVRGRPPFAPTFASASASTTLKRHIFEKPLPLHVRYANAPFVKTYENVCFKALAKTANRRQLTVAELERELEQLLVEEMRSQIVPLSAISGRNPTTSRRLRTQVIQQVTVEAEPSVVVTSEPVAPKAEAPKAEAPKAEPVEMKVEAPKSEPAPKPQESSVEVASEEGEEDPGETAAEQVGASSGEHQGPQRRGDATLVFAGLGPAVRELAEAARRNDDTDDEGTGEQEGRPAGATPGPQTRRGKKQKGRKGSTGAPVISNAAPTTEVPRPSVSPTVTVASVSGQPTIVTPKAEAPTGEKEARPASATGESPGARIRRKDETTVVVPKDDKAAGKAKTIDEQEEWFTSADQAGGKKSSRMLILLLLAAVVIVVVVILLVSNSKPTAESEGTPGPAATPPAAAARYQLEAPGEAAKPGEVGGPAEVKAEVPVAVEAKADVEKPEAVAEAAKVGPQPVAEVKTEPAIEPPKAEIKPVEAPKAEVKPAVEAPKVEAPKVEVKAVVEAPKAEVKPKVEAPKVEAPKVEVKPKVEAPKVEAPKVEPAKTDTPEDAFRAQAQHYLKLGIEAYKAENYKLAAGYFKKAQTADPSNPTASSYLKKAQEKLTP